MARHAPSRKVDVYRSNNVSIRIRIIDRDFAGMDAVERDATIWNFLDELPDEVVSEITLLLLYTPSEAEKSFANMEFENPIMKHVATIRTPWGEKRIYERRDMLDTSDSRGRSLTPGRISFQTDGGVLVEQKSPGCYDWWILDGQEFKAIS